MFEVIGSSSVLILIVLLYVFRKPITQFNNDAPIMVSNIMSTAVKATGHLDEIVTTNIIISSADCTKQVNKALRELDAEECTHTVEEAYQQIKFGIKKKVL